MNTKGFSLVELIVSITIGLIIMLAIYAASEMGQRSSVGIGRKVVTQQDARSALDLMAVEISMASYNPLLRSNIWKASDCNTMSGNQIYKGLQIAKSDQILIEMDIDRPLNDGKPDGLIGAGITKNEIIYYNYDAPNKVITRNVSCGVVDHPLLGGANAETNVINFVEGVPVFRYYDKAGNEILTLDTDQTLIPNIRRVEITIVAETLNTDPNTQNTRKMIYSTTTIVRNHVLSP